jgi:hypothetical protein
MKLNGVCMSEKTAGALPAHVNKKFIIMRLYERQIPTTGFVVGIF